MTGKKSLIDRMPDGELSPSERQETRYTNHRVINDLIPSEDMHSMKSRIDDLWWAFGWLVLTLKNWKALGFALILIIVIGGQDLVDFAASKASEVVE